MSEPDDLEERVDRFERLNLPGQPQMMHMGTAYLVADLWREVQRLRNSNENKMRLDRKIDNRGQ